MDEQSNYLRGCATGSYRANIEVLSSSLDANSEEKVACYPYSNFLDATALKKESVKKTN